MATEAVVRLIIQRLNHLLEDLDGLQLVALHIGACCIRDELQRLTKFLQASVVIADQDGCVRAWLKQVRDIAIEIEDTIDNFELYVFHDPNLEECRIFARFLQRSFWTIYRKIYLSPLLQTRIKGLFKRVLAISRQHPQNINLMVVEDASSSPVRIPPFVGRADDLVVFDWQNSLLLEWLLEEQRYFMPIAILGPEGSGATTVAKQLYTDRLVMKHFDCRAWVTLSRRCNTRNVLLHLMEQFCPSLDKAKAWTNEELLKEVSLYLQGKRYLVVLDDVQTGWDVNDILPAFPKSRFDSRLLVVTPTSDGASCALEHILPTHALSVEEAWEFFKRKAFPPDGICPAELEDTAKQIVIQCGWSLYSLTLAASLLQFEPQKKWLDMVKILKDALASGRKNIGSVPTRLIQLSFNNLPDYLKCCLLYFCVFSEDAPIRVTRLIRLWTAEGFVQDGENETAEEVAKDSLSALIAWNLVQSSELHEDGSLRSCQVHNLVRGQILAIAREENFAFNTRSEGTMLQNTVRRLSIRDYFQWDANLTSLHKLRSLCISGVVSLYSDLIQMSFASFRLLKVLDFEGVPFKKFPTGVENLLLLKYLGLRYSYIQELPRSIGSLVDLETLDLKGSPVSTLPKEILKLKHLRHLQVCHHSRHGVSVPKGIGMLNSLQSLGCIELLEESAAEVGDLGTLINMRRLCIAKLSGGGGISLCSSIEKMVHLCSLKVIFSGGDQRLNLEAMSSPPPGLQYLSLRGCLERLPSWVNLLQNLVKLTLSGSGLIRDPFVILASLPNLVVLVLISAYEGEVLRCDAGGFPSLRVLKLFELYCLETLNAEDGAFPCLEDLQIQECPNLKHVSPSVRSLVNMNLEETSQQLLVNGEEKEAAKHKPRILRLFNIAAAVSIVGSIVVSFLADISRK